MSVKVLIGLLLLLNILFLVSPSSGTVVQTFDNSLIGTWTGTLNSLVNTLTINVDGTFTGRLLGLGISGFVTTDVTVTPLAVDLHLNLGVTLPGIYTLTTDVDGVVVLTLGIVQNLLDILLGVVLRPLGFTPANTLALLKSVPTVIGVLDAPTPPPPPPSNSTMCGPTLSCTDCKDNCTKLCQDLNQNSKDCKNKCRAVSCGIFCE